MEKKYFGQIQNIKKAYAMSSSEIGDYLKCSVANKVTRKRVAREYNL